MLTKPSAELTLFNTLSRLTFTRAAKLLGPKGNRLIATGGKFDIDLTAQVKFDRDMFVCFRQACMTYPAASC